MRITYYVASSLDGYIADAQGGVGWLERVADGDEDYGYHAFFDGVDALVMGRATWDFVESAGGWPYGDLPARIFTHRPIEAPGNHVRAVSGDPGPVAAELDALGCRHLWVVGGGALASAFLAAGLLTDVIISVVPVVLGGGAPLFGPSPVPMGLELVDVDSFPSGLVQMHHRAAGTVPAA
ncbi:MAG: dihydrofolate reductase family protein [Longimicrobiales bacterium]